MSGAVPRSCPLALCLTRSKRCWHSLALPSIQPPQRPAPCRPTGRRASRPSLPDPRILPHPDTARGRLAGCRSSLERPAASGLVQFLWTCFLYPEGVGSQSPGSRSAPWVTPAPHAALPRRGSITRTRLWIQPLRGTWCGAPSPPRVRCATLGSEIQPLRGKANRSIETALGVGSLSFARCGAAAQRVGSG